MSEKRPLQSVRGTHDLYAESLAQHLAIVEVGRQQARLAGCEEVATPIFEFSEVFARTLGEASDIVTKEMYSFTDRGGESLTLRPEGTAGIARAFISNGWAQKKPLRLFYAGPMFRYERPQKGRLRQFHQMGVEFLAEESAEADLECIALARAVLNSLSPQGQVLLHVNSIGDLDSRARFRQQLVDYLTPLKSKLSEESQARLVSNPLRILDSKSAQDQELLKRAPLFADCLSQEARIFFDRIRDGLEQLKISYVVDPKLVRGLDYYSHTVFEFKSDGLGAQDTVLAGGRYDQLISQMGGPVTPSVGWAAGIERLALLCHQEPAKEVPVVLVPLGELAEKKALELLILIREQGVAAQVVRGGNLSKKMKKADRFGAKKVVLFGDEELAKKEWILKDLETGSQKSILTEELLESVTNF